MIGESPAARAKLRRGDQILKIQGRDVKGMDPESAKSLINSNVSTGVTFSIKHPDGSLSDVTLKDGPIYPLVDDELKVE